jgi:hypothetical protein
LLAQLRDKKELTAEIEAEIKATLEAFTSNFA